MQLFIQWGLASCFFTVLFYIVYCIDNHGSTFTRKSLIKKASAAIHKDPNMKSLLRELAKSD